MYNLLEKLAEAVDTPEWPEMDGTPEWLGMDGTPVLLEVAGDTESGCYRLAG